MAEKETHDSTSLMLSLMPRLTQPTDEAMVPVGSNVAQKDKDKAPAVSPTQQPTNGLSHVVSQCFTSEEKKDEQPG